MSEYRSRSDEVFGNHQSCRFITDILSSECYAMLSGNGLYFIMVVITCTHVRKGSICMASQLQNTLMVVLRIISVPLPVYITNLVPWSINTNTKYC